jgi:hypothetical protein
LDYFSLSANVGDTIYLTLYDLPADYNLCLYDPAQIVITCSNNSGTTKEVIEETASVTGKYYARIYGVQGVYDEDTPYALYVAINQPCTAVTDVDISGPTTVVSGTTHIFTATVSPPTATLSIKYTWQATEQNDVVQTGYFAQTATGFVWDTDGPKTITVTAVNCGGVVSATHALAVGETPDLIITDVWSEEGYYPQTRDICYQIRNIGDVVAPQGHYTYLSIDGQQAVPDLVDKDLAVGERLNRCFGLIWQCTLPEDTINVCADGQAFVVESDETNNCITETWKCDTIPPTITSGPTVSQIDQTSATVTWTTDEDSDSVVEFGRYAGGYEDQESDATQSTEHEILLTDLNPATVYHYIVKSTDASGNTVTSGRGFFETEPEQAGEPPSMSPPMVTRIEGYRELYRITVPVSDALGIERVEFYMDERLIGIDYSADFLPGSHLKSAPAGADAAASQYAFRLDPAALKMSRTGFFGTQHTMLARAFDKGKMLVCEQSVLYAPDFEPSPINLRVLPNYHPTLYVDGPGGALPGGTTINVSVHASTDEWRWNLFTGDPLGIVESAVERVVFEVGGTPVYTWYPDEGDFDHAYSWDVGGLGVGTYRIGVRAYASDGGSIYSSRTLTVEQGEASLEVSRSVTRVDNYFRVRLTLLSKGTASVGVSHIRDNVTGFQAISTTSSSA